MARLESVDSTDLNNEFERLETGNINASFYYCANNSLNTPTVFQYKPST